MSPGVVQIVGNGRTPIPVAGPEIERLQLAVESELPRQPWPYVNIGQRVRVTHGCLRALEGILINFKGSQRVVLSITLLQRSVAVEIDQAWIAAVEAVGTEAVGREFAEKTARVPVSSY